MFYIIYNMIRIDFHFRCLANNRILMGYLLLTSHIVHQYNSNIINRISYQINHCITNRRNKIINIIVASHKFGSHHNFNTINHHRFRLTIPHLKSINYNKHINNSHNSNHKLKTTNSYHFNNNKQITTNHHSISNHHINHQLSNNNYHSNKTYHNINLKLGQLKHQFNRQLIKCNK